MTAEQLVVLALIVAAFVAGWVARGSGGSGEAAEAPEAGEPTPGPSPRTVTAAPGADPVAAAARALALAASAYETAVDRWLDERDQITPAGRAAVGELERAVQRLDAQAARLDELDHPLADAALDALDALREGTRELDAFRDGAALDAATSRTLDRVDDELDRARAAFERART